MSDCLHGLRYLEREITLFCRIARKFRYIDIFHKYFSSYTYMNIII